MRGDVLALALIVGACTWAFRVLPLRADLTRLPPGGLVARLLAATGPAALATLTVSSLLPYLLPGAAVPTPATLAGVLAVVVVFAISRSVVLSTLAGAAVHGLVVAAMSGLTG